MQLAATLMSVTDVGDSVINNTKFQLILSIRQYNRSLISWAVHIGENTVIS